MSNHISAHEVCVFDAVRSRGWQTAREISVVARVGERTARKHASGLADLGVFDRLEMFNGYRYRLRSRPDRSASAHIAALDAVREALGLPDPAPPFGLVATGRQVAADRRPRMI